MRVSPARGGNAEGKGGPTTSDWSWLPKSALQLPHRTSFIAHQNTRIPFHNPDSPSHPHSRSSPKSKPPTEQPSYSPLTHPSTSQSSSSATAYVAIAIAHDETIAVSKTDTRWVPNRHRAGGQSANRFKRSREKWAREFFDKSARLAAERFNSLPPPHRPPNLRRRQTRHQPIPPTSQPPQQPLRPHPHPTPKPPPPKPQRPKTSHPPSLVLHNLRTRRQHKNLTQFPLAAVTSATTAHLHARWTGFTPKRFRNGKFRHELKITIIFLVRRPIIVSGVWSTNLRAPGCNVVRNAHKEAVERLTAQFVKIRA